MFLLAPFAWLFQLIINFRNYLYDKGWKSVYKSKIPTIIIGNISTGGTGKTPHTGFLLEYFAQFYNVAVLSRGYKRQTKGYIKADKHSTALQIGDEPMEYLTKISNITVCVGEDRVYATKQIEQLSPQIDLLFLDDALQHRAIDAHLKILLTTYDNPYYEDYLLPMGNLRESKNGAKRAQYIVVTKCPNDLNYEQQQAIIGRIKPLHDQQVLFSSYKYNAVVDIISSKTIEVNKQIVLISGIAKSQNLKNYLEKNYGSIIHEKLKDHHTYSHNEIANFLTKYPKEKYQIILTRKDAVKWYPYVSLVAPQQIGIIDIEVQFLTNPGNLINDINKLVKNVTK